MGKYRLSSFREGKKTNNYFPLSDIVADHNLCIFNVSCRVSIGKTSIHTENPKIYKKINRKNSCSNDSNYSFLEFSSKDTKDTNISCYCESQSFLTVPSSFFLNIYKDLT